MVKRLDEAPAMRFPAVLSRTKVQEQDSAKLVRHSLRCLIARTQIPKGVEDFLNTYAQKPCGVDQRQHIVQYENINIARAYAQKLDPSKPAVRSVHQGSTPPPLAPPPPPQPSPCSARPPRRQCLRLHHWLMISNMWRVLVMGLKRFTVTRPLRCRMKISKWDGVHIFGIKLLVLFFVMGQSWTKFPPAFRFCDFIVSFVVMVETGLNFVQTRLCCEFASFQHCSIVVAHLLATLNSVSF